MTYNGPTTKHFTEGKRYDVIQSFEHPLLGPVSEIKNDRGEKSLITETNKLFVPVQ